MRYWIAKAVLDAREEAGRIQVHIAAELGRDQSTIARFEEPANENRKPRRASWPRDLDETITAYARDLDVDPRELWLRALELWFANEEAEHAARAVEDAREASRQFRAQSRERQHAKEKRPAAG